MGPAVLSKGSNKAIIAMKSSVVIALLAAVAKAADHVVNQTTCAGTTYQYTGLAGFGLIPSNATDKYGDTIGGIGSSIAVDQATWRKESLGSYTGTLYAIPDRGWYVDSHQCQSLAYTYKLLYLGIPMAPSTFRVESRSSISLFNWLLKHLPSTHPSPTSTWNILTQSCCMAQTASQQQALTPMRPETSLTQASPLSPAQHTPAMATAAPAKAAIACP